KAMLLYARYQEENFFGRDESAYLSEALACASQPQIILTIKKQMLSGLKPEDWQQHGEFVRQCYVEFPDDAVVNYSFGEHLYFVKNDYAAAHAHHVKANAIDPGFIHAYFARARTAEQLGLY